MVTSEQLEAFDMLLWHRSGAQAALACICDESSITRRVQAVQKVFGIKLIRSQELRCVGDVSLLRLQRQVMQHARFQGKAELRLDGTHLIRRHLALQPLQPWRLGPCDHRGSAVFQDFLKDRLLDAWITSSIDDAPVGRGFTVIRLWDWPWCLAAHSCHPEASERQPSLAALSRYPSLSVPSSHYPNFAAQLAAKGLGRGTSMRRFDRGPWDRMADDAKTLVYGSCLSLADHNSLVELEVDLGIPGGESLVVLAEWADHPALLQLLDQLRLLQEQLQSRFPELVGYL